MVRQAAESLRDRRWVLATSILGSSLAFIDGSVLGVAMPAIQADLALSIEGAQWVVNAYMLMLGALVLVGGAAGDRFGLRRLFVIGILLFATASLLCGLAPSGGFLIAARAVQGVGAALLVPNSLALISAAYAKAERGRAIGSWAGFSALTTALGPVLGGWLVDQISWRAIFFLNLPLAAIAVLLALSRIAETRRDSSDDTPLDWRGAALAILGLGALAYGFSAASSLGWAHAAVVGALTAGSFLLLLFLRVEARATAPMLPLALFRARAFSGANLMTLLLYAALSGALFLLPFELIRLQHYSATAAGAAFLPLTLLMALLSRWTGGLADRYGARLPLTIGPLIAALGCALLALPARGESYWTSFFPAMLVLGIGMSIAVAPLTTLVMGTVAEEHAGTASGINNAVARIASLLAVALLGALATGLFAAQLEARLAPLDLPPEIRTAVAGETHKLAAAGLPEGLPAALRQQIEPAMADALLQSFRLSLLAAALLAAASALCARLMIPPRRKRG